MKTDHLIKAGKGFLKSRWRDQVVTRRNGMAGVQADPQDLFEPLNEGVNLFKPASQAGAAAGEPDAAGDASQNQTVGDDEDVVDADFEEVKDDKK